MYLSFETGGSGRLPLLIPVTVCLFIIAGFINQWQVPHFVSDARFIRGWLPWLSLGILLPILGALLNDYPTRTLLSSLSIFNSILIMWFGYYFGSSIPTYYRNRLWTGSLCAAITMQFLYSMLQFLAKHYRTFELIYSPMRMWDLLTQIASNNFISARSIGFYENPNTLGFSAALFLIVSFYTVESKIIKYSLCTMCLAILLLSQSRGIIASLLILMLISTLNDIFRLKMRSFVYGCGLSIIAILISVLIYAYVTDDQYYDRIISFAGVFMSDYQIDENLSARIALWKAALDYWNSHLFGSLGPPEYMLGTAIDSDWYRMLAQGGPLYVITFISLIAHSLFIKTEHIETQCLKALSILIAVAGFTQVPTLYPPIVVYWFIVGISFVRVYSPNSNIS